MSGLRLHSAWYGRSLSPHERAQLSGCMPMDTYRVYRACVELMDRNGCVRCWLQRHCCICHSLPPLPPLLLAPHRVVLLLHHLEFGRASNTGKLMLRPTRAESDGGVASSEQTVGVQWLADSPLSSPLLSSPPSFNADGVMLLVAGIPAHDAALNEICDADKEGLRTFVLFPSPDSVTVEQHMQRARTAASVRTAEGASMAPTAERGPPVAQTIIAVDGTYSQAGQLVRRIPRHITRVKLAHCQRTEEQYHQYVQTVKHRMEHRENERERDNEQVEEEEDDDEEDEQADVHRRGKQWSGADSHTAAPTTTATVTSSATLQLPSSSSVTSPSFLSSSFFTAVRKQPQSDRVSTIEAIAFCLYSLQLEAQAADQQPSTDSHPPPPVPFPSSVLDSLLLLVDALRLQAGLYQQYRTHSRHRRQAIKAARRLLYTPEEQQRRRTEQGTAEEAPLCKPFNKQVGCSKQQCRYVHRCGHCGGEHSFVQCPQGPSLMTVDARSIESTTAMNVQKYR